MRETKKPIANPRGRPVITDEKRQEMRRKIAQVAKELFQDEGYSKISMRRIAAEIECSPMTLYKYYDAKIEILSTLWSDVFTELFDQLTALSVKPSERLESISSAYVRYWLDNPNYYRLVFMAEGITQPDVSVFVNSPELEERLNIFGNAISEANPGGLKPDETKVKLDSLLCFLNGIVHNHITISGYAWSHPDKMVKAAITAIKR